MSDFAGKAGLVTGAANGIGRATALTLSRRGASLILADRDRAGGEAVAAAIRYGGGEAHFIETDVSRLEDCERLVDAARRRFGRLDIAVNNAAIIGVLAPLAEHPISAWHDTIGVNLTGVFYCLRAELPLMLESGGGSIVNLTSIAGLIATPNQTAYIAAKHGVVGLTRSVCTDYGASGIRCNAIAPGATETAMLPGGIISDEFRAALPARRAGKPEEIADAIVWLCSPASSYVNGVCFPVDGGYLGR